VKVTISESVPTTGTTVGVLHENVPTTEAVPPVRVDEPRVWPKSMALAVGHAVTVGVALLFTVTVTEPVTVL
jgi:hypothetical protein